MAETIVQVPLETAMARKYIDYAMSVIKGRALPNVMDGLKPVHVRILYSMYNLGLAPNKPYMKSARVVGDVLGKYHPHGDQSVYDAQVKMAQDFATRYPLVDGHGNWGSIDGDSAAAMRYTEAKLTNYGYAMLKDIEKNTVDMVPNYDDKELEPSMMPTLIPNLLANGSDGIAVGFATKIPPHNLGNLYDAIDYMLLCTLNEEEYNLDGIIKRVVAPDFPTGGTIIDNGGLREMYSTGKGKFIVRSKYEIEGQNIIVTEIPYQINKAKLIEAIANLSKDEKDSNGNIKSKAKLPELKVIRDESDKDGLRIAMEFKRDANMQRVIGVLLKYSDLQVSYSSNIVSLVDLKPVELSIKDMLDSFLAHAARVILRRTQFDLDKATARLNVVEGILKLATDDSIGDAVNDYMRHSDNPKEDIIGLGFNAEQVEHIMGMRYSAISKASVAKFIEEKNGLETDIVKWNAILSDNTALLNDMRVEFADLKEALADPRRTEVQYGEGAQINEDDLVKEENLIVTLSSDGLIKSVEEKEYKTQGRGGKGVKAADTKDNEILKAIFTVNSKDDILFFTNLGRCHVLKAYKIAKASRTAKGKSINNYISLENNEYVVSMLSTADASENSHILFVTRYGTIKRLGLDQLSSRLSVTRVIDFKDGDELVTACLVEPDSEAIIFTALGKGIRIQMNAEGSSQIRPMGRSAVGIRGINLKDNDIVVDMIKVEPGDLILTVTQKGFGKKTAESEYNPQGRGGGGIIAHKVTEKTGCVVSVLALKGNEELFVVTEGGQVTRILSESISIFGRSTSGVKVMNLNEGDSIVSMSKLATETESQDCG